MSEIHLIIAKFVRKRMFVPIDSEKQNIPQAIPFAVWLFSSSLRLSLCFLSLCLLISGCDQARTASKSDSISVTIEGDSMQPHYGGFSFSLVCDRCRFPFRMVFSPSDRSEFVCPNCGEWFQPTNPCVVTNRVVMQPLAAEQIPERFSVVVFKHPEVADQIGIKRVAGLPGEKVRIDGGDLWVDGKLVQKPLSIQRSMAIKVYEERYLLNLPELSQCLDLAKANGETQSFLKRLELDFVNSYSGFVFENRRHYFSRLPRDEPVPIQDVDWFQNEPARDLNLCSDLAIELQLGNDLPDEIQVALHDQYAWSQCSLNLALLRNLNCSETSEWLKISYDDHSVKFFPSQKGIDYLAKQLQSKHPIMLWLSNFDRCMTLGVDNQEIVAASIERPHRSAKATAQPIVLLWKNRPSTVSIKSILCRDFCVYRDLVYLESNCRMGAIEFPRLDADAYLLLGDNAVRSRDSRNWKRPFARHSEIIGLVK